MKGSVALGLLLMLIFAVPAMAASTWQQTSGPGGGDISFVALDPANTQTIYVVSDAEANDLVFKTTNGGASWSPAYRGLPTATVYELVVDPVNSQVVYAATSDGVFKSTDGAATWFGVNNNLPSTYAVSLAIDRNGSHALYAGTLNGLFRSTDGGASWTEIDAGISNKYISAIAIDPSNSQVIYVGNIGGGVYPSGVYKSVNGGSSWTQITPAGDIMDVVTIAIDPTNNQTLYVGLTERGAFKSTNGGASWTEINNGFDFLPTVAATSFAINPAAPQTVYVSVPNEGIYKSTNGGASWETSNNGFKIFDAGYVVLDPVTDTLYAGTGTGVYKSTNAGAFWSEIDTRLAGSYVVAVATGSGGIVYAATDYAVFRSSDAAATWSRVFETPGGASLATVVVDPNNSQTVYAAGSGIFKSTNGGSSWSAIGSELGEVSVETLAIDPSNSQIVYAGITDNINGRGQIFKSTNGGASWSPSSSVFTGSNPDVHYLAIDPVNTRTVYAAVGGDIFKSTDGGASWFPVNNGLQDVFNVFYLAIDPTTPQTIYASTLAGVYKSTNGGGNWFPSSDGLAEFVHSLLIDRSNSRIVYAATSAGVFRSLDAGVSWREVSSGLSVSYVNDLAQDPQAPLILYAGTAGGGVFKGNFGGISGTPPTKATAGEPYSFVPVATNATAFGITNLPAWASFDTGTGALTGTPNRAQVGVYRSIVISAALPTGIVALPPFSITVILPLPTISGTPAGSVTSGTSYSFTPTASDATSFSITNKPPWANFDPRTGTLSGTPPDAAAGFYDGIRIGAANSTGTAWLDPFSITVLSLKNWTSVDVGSVGVAGSTSYLNGVFTETGSGANIWGTVDAFRFTYLRITGDAEIVARVTSVQNTNGYAKGGVMIRESLAPDSAHAMMDLMPVYGAEFSRRMYSGGTTSVTAKSGIAAPYWVKLVRNGDTLTGYIARDGINWTMIGSSEVYMPGTVYVGLIVNSHNNSVLCKATMDSVKVTGQLDMPTAIIVDPQNGAAYRYPATVPISAVATASGGATVTKVDFFAGATHIGSASTSPYSVTWSNVSAGNYALTAKVTDSNGFTATSAPVNITVSGGGLPAPWLTQDVGSVGLAGTASFLNGSYTVKGSGANIYGTADAFRFVYQPISGDVTIVARVTALQNTNTYAKAGVMIRQSLTANSAHAMMDVTPTSGAEFSRRTSTGGSTTATSRTGIAAPYWVKLVRSGGTLTGSISPDGVTWSQVGSATISMSGTVYVGLIVNSHNNSVLCTGTFENVSVTGGGTDTPPTVTAFSIPATSSSLTVPVTTFTAVDNVAVTGYLVTESSTRPSASASGWSATPPTSYTFATGGTKTLYAWAKDAAGGVSSSRSATVTIATGALPSPWLTQDIGSVGVIGSASYANGTFTVKGSGADIWGTADAFRFVYKVMSGDGQIIARVASVQNTNSYAKGGVMMRQSLNANSMHAMMDLRPTGGAEFSRRTSTGGTTSATTRSGIAAPYWVKLVRSGNTFTGYVSSNGTTWSQVGSTTISMTSSIYVGLIVNSHSNSVLCTTSIDSVK
jgi:regulation of enolase protein 1 (concanavalin A-like superfamily)